MSVVSIDFNPETHTYTINGTVVISVTQLLQKHGIIGFNGFTNRIIEEARERGTFFHKEAELVGKGELDLSEMLSEQADQFAIWFSALISKPLYTEKICHYGTVYAGTADMIYQDKDGLVLVDYKTGAFHKKEHSWQLTLYKKALAEEGIVIARMEVWCFKDNTIHVVDEIPEAEVNALLSADQNGTAYGTNLTELDDATSKDLIQLTEMLRNAREYELAIKDATKGIDECKQKILDFMLAHNIETVDNALVKVTAVKASKRKSVDSKALEKDHPDIYKEYLKESTVKPSLRVTWRDEE